MIISGDYLFVGLILLAGILTAISLKVSLVLFRLGASISWLALSLLLLTNQLRVAASTNTTSTETVVSGNVTSIVTSATVATSPLFGTPWSQVLGFVFLVMTMASFTLQLSTAVKTEAKGKSWIKWGREPTDTKVPRSRSIKDRHRERLKGVRR